MRLHFVGLGKLGLPVALALEQAGHHISGWDASSARRSHISARCVPEMLDEPHLLEHLRGTRLELAQLWDLPIAPDIVLVCVQTPHQPEFEGVTPLDRPAEDFDYSWLKKAVAQTVVACDEGESDPLIVVVSTCLPGTFEREIRPLLGDHRFAYHPLFIAMGSVIDDFRDPEFVLVGTDDGDAPRDLRVMYGPVLKRGTGDAGGVIYQVMSVTSAELTKVAYNAFIGQKLMLANGVAMTADAVGADADDVMGALKLASKRLVSDAYLTPGMGDGGGCHPRDQIALSWLAGHLELPHDPYRAIIEHREAHARWLAELWTREARVRRLAPVMLGTAYKPNSTLTTGSHARLVAHYAAELAHCPLIVTDEPVPDHEWPVGCYFLATAHDHFLAARLPAGSVVVDPWGVFLEREGLEIIRPGRAHSPRFHHGGVIPADGFDAPAWLAAGDHVIPRSKVDDFDL